MITKEQVEQLCLQALEGSDLFLVNLSVGSSNQIDVVLDGDQGVRIEDCKLVSRHIERVLDEQRELDPVGNDFSLTVGSPGVDEPFVMKRQYKKNQGRKVKVLRKDGQVVEGLMTDVAEDCITLEWKAREPKEVGKGKRTVVHTEKIGYEDIKEAKVVITF